MIKIPSNQCFVIIYHFYFYLQVIDPINKLIDTVEFDAAFYSLDWHPADHVSFIDNIKQRPIHPTSPVNIQICFLITYKHT